MIGRYDNSFRLHKCDTVTKNTIVVQLRTNNACSVNIIYSIRKSHKFSCVKHSSNDHPYV